jgi:hypothetical protein
MSSQLNQAQLRNFERWQIMGTYVWPNSWFYANSTSHAEIIDNMKSWIGGRMTWIDNNLPGTADNCGYYLQPDFTIEKILGLNDPENLTIFPNPSSSQITIKSHEIIQKVEIRNITGQMVQLIYPEPDQEIIINHHYKDGTYFVGILTSSGYMTKKIVVCQ